MSEALQGTRRGGARARAVVEASSSSNPRCSSGTSMDVGWLIKSYAEERVSEASQGTRRGGARARAVVEASAKAIVEHERQLERIL